MNISIESLWLLVGAMLVVAEAFVAPGVGLLFAGIGAIIAGLLIGFGLLPADNLVLQFAVFFAFTAATAALLWKKIKGFRQGKETYSNIVGDGAVVESDALKKGMDGKIKWSGTMMKARLIENAVVPQISKGAEVIIEELRGNVALCRPAGEEKP